MVLDISLVFSAVRHLVVRVLCDVPLCSQLLLASAVKDTKVSKLARGELFIMPISFRPKNLLSHERRKKKFKRNRGEWSGGIEPHQQQPLCAAGDSLTILEKKDEK